MPAKGPRLTNEQVGRAAGRGSDPGRELAPTGSVSASRGHRSPCAGRRCRKFATRGPKFPPTRSTASSFTTGKSTASRRRPLTDAAFLRRVSLDLTGLLPTPDETAAFVADGDPQKRPRPGHPAARRPRRLRRPLAHASGTTCCATTTPAPATSTAAASRSPLGSTSAARKQAVRPVRPRADQPDRRRPKASPRASCGAAR